MSTILDVHRCAGARTLLTSAALKSEEMNLASAGSAIRRYAPTLPIDALDGVTVLDGGDGMIYKTAVNGIQLDDRDCSLIAAAESYTADSVRIVTDDLELFDVVSELFAREDIETTAVLGMELIVNMYSCGALTFEDVELMAGLEQEHHRGRQLHPATEARKMRLVHAALNRAAQIRVMREEEVAAEGDR